eukprot:219380_1
MAQKQISIPQEKLKQWYLNVYKCNQMQLQMQSEWQEMMGTDPLNENHDEDDNAFLERSILSQMTMVEMDSMRSNLHSRLVSRKLDWPHISSALMHELDERASSHVMKAVAKLNISVVRLSKAMEQKLSKKMTKQEIHYIRNLIDRASQNTTESAPATALLNRRQDAAGDTDTSGLNADMLIDIFETRRLYKFSNFQFETYSKKQFMETLETNKFIKQNKD